MDATADPCAVPCSAASRATSVVDAARLRWDANEESLSTAHQLRWGSTPGYSGSGISEESYGWGRNWVVLSGLSLSEAEGLVAATSW